MLSAAARAALQRDRAELRMRARRRGAGDVGDVADRVDAGRAVDRQVGLDVDAAAAPARQPGGGGERRRHDAAAPDDAAGPDHRAVGERRRARAPISVTATPRCMRTPLRVRTLAT